MAAELYTPGTTFKAEELQILSQQGFLRHMIGGVYAPRSAAPTRSLRSRAAQLLLTPHCREQMVFCGETAAWIHLGGGAPQRLTLISRTFRRNRPVEQFDWQVHQIRLRRHELCSVARASVTTPLRTAADLFLGVGTVRGTSSLDKKQDPHRNQLISRLLHQFSDQISASDLIAAINARVSNRRQPAVRQAVEQSTDYWISRRLPTVR